MQKDGTAALINCLRNPRPVPAHTNLSYLLPIEKASQHGDINQRSMLQRKVYNREAVRLHGIVGTIMGLPHEASSSYPN